MYKPTPYFVAGIATAIFVFGALFALKASADDTIRWQHPSEYVAVAPNPAQPLDAADIQHTIIRVFDSETDTTVNSTIVVERALDADPLLPPPVSVIVARAVPVSGSTTQCYDAATVMKVSAGGEQSTFTSPKLCKTVTAPARKPKRPVNVTVQ